MTFECSTHPLSKISSDALLLFAFQQEKSFQQFTSFLEVDALLNGKLQKACELDAFDAKQGSLVLCIPDGEIVANRVLVVGLGKKEEFTVDVLRRVMGSVAKSLKGKVDSLSLSIPEEVISLNDLTVLAKAVVEGLHLGSYTFVKYKSEEKSERDFALTIFSVANDQEKKIVEQAISHATLVADATVLARDLVNESGTVMTPTALASLAMDIAKKNPKQVTCKIYDKKDVEKMGMGGFLAVGQASSTPLKFIHLEYHPAKKSKRKLALVGKGITFDTGGINVKPGDHMKDMQMDMAGAAAVLGVFSVISEIKPDFSVMGLIAATPNSVAGTSMLPGDVAKAYNGKTIEILHTDAEGRVTLADSLSFAVKNGATEIIDLATLTGAVLVALGTDIAALFANNHDLAEKIKSAAFDAGEKVWELPLEKDYKDLNKSEVADIANIPNTRYAGTITAALFLEAFVKDVSWAHLDIAGPAMFAKPTDICPKGGSGFGVRTLLQYLQEK